MKPGAMQESPSAAIISLIAFALLSMLLMGCDRKDAPRKEKQKTEAHGKTQMSGEKQEEAEAVILSAEQVKAAGIETQEVTSGTFGTPLSATAMIELNNDRVSRIGSRVAGRIVKVAASQGDRVKAGQPLAYLESVDLDQAWSDYAKAKGRQALSAASLKREETLFEKKIAPEKDVLRARQEFSEAEADLALTSKRLRILGVEESKLGSPSDALKNNHPLIAIPSPISGVVVEKSVTQGEMVNPEKVLFTAADLSTLWVVIDIYEKNISQIKPGLEVKLFVAAYPDTAFKGRISYVGDVMDEKTRTVKARVTVDNAKGLLKPGMFATVSMDSGRDSRADKIVIIPEEAIFLDGSERYVFLREAGGRFAVRRVSAGATSGEKIEIKEGLKAGDRVVVKGVFALKSELKKELLHADEH
jgi:cobalt-zinc-cadmium efflux system membrane fusion protein